MTTLPFGPLHSDLADLNNPGVTVAKNCRPLGQGYKELLSPNVITDALDARARGSTVQDNSTGVYSTYAGDETNLYILSSGVWADASTGHTLSEEDNWEFARWDDKVIAVAISEEPVEDTIGTGTFSTFMTSTNKPKAHHVAVVGNFLVLGDVNDSSGVKRNRVTWSALGDRADFDADAQTLAGAEDLEGEGGQIQKIIGGFSGLIFQRNGIWKMTFEGPPTIFRFDRISGNIGLIAKGGVVQFAGNVFFLSEDGFYRISVQGGELTPIGDNKINDTVLNEIEKTELFRVSAALDVENGLIYFSYPTGAGNPTRLAIYNPFQDRWSTAELEHEILALTRTAAFDIDSAPLATIDIDAAPYNIDSSEFKGGDASISVFDTAHRLAVLGGSALPATIETGESPLIDGRRAYINRARPLVTGPNAVVTVSVGTRELLTGTTSFTADVPVNAEGEAPVRASGRYMKFRTTVTGGFDDALGVEVEPTSKGRK